MHKVNISISYRYFPTKKKAKLFMASLGASANACMYSTWGATKRYVVSWDSVK